MIGLDLGAELRACPSAFDPRHRDLLVQLGLPSDLILHLSDLRVGRIKPHGDFFDFAEDGEAALIVPAFDGPMPCFVAPVDPPPPLIDLIAILLSQPRRFYLRAGTADSIGADRIASAHTWQEPAPLVATPLDWLRACCATVCLLRDDAVWHLLGVPRINVDDLPLAERIDHLRRRTSAAMPEIFVPAEPQS